MRSPSSKYLYGMTSTFGVSTNQKDAEAAVDAEMRAEAKALAPRRRQRDDTCAYCLRFQPGEMYPPHDASRYCESGKRNHCTCDTCF